MTKAKDTWHICWRDWFYYDETSPTFLRWATNITRHNSKTSYVVQKGDIAGTFSAGRAFVKVWQERFNAARVIHEMEIGPLTPHLSVDHIDGNPKNNKVDNLRAVCSMVNSHNASKSKRNTSGVKGVSRQRVLDRDGTTERFYWTAGWREGGKYKSVSFSIQKLGESEALQRACAARKDALLRMNEHGAGYTERHIYE